MKSEEQVPDIKLWPNVNRHINFVAIWKNHQIKFRKKAEDQRCAWSDNFYFQLGYVWMCALASVQNSFVANVSMVVWAAMVRLTYLLALERVYNGGETHSPFNKPLEIEHSRQSITLFVLDNKFGCLRFFFFFIFFIRCVHALLISCFGHSVRFIVKNAEWRITNLLIEYLHLVVFVCGTTSFVCASFFYIFFLYCTTKT